MYKRIFLLPILDNQAIEGTHSLSMLSLSCEMCRNMNDGEEAEATRRSDGAMEGREGEEGEEGVGKETLGDGTDGVEGEGEQEHAGIDRKDEVEMQGGTLAGDESVWRGKLPQVEPNKEEEFDDYFRGMFL